MIGIGVDLVEVDRMRQALGRTPRLAARLFTDAEQRYAEAASDPAERYAVRFAAKEAVLKALGVGIGAVSWHEIEVVRSESGRPVLALDGKALALANSAGITEWLLTLTHTSSMAEAIAVAQ